MFRADVFDMDGVITDTEKLYRRFQLEEGKKLGIPDDVMVVACERIAGGTKYTNKKSFEDVVGMGIDYFDFREAVVNKLDAHIRAHGVELKPGVADTLKYLKEKGYTICVLLRACPKKDSWKAIHQLYLQQRLKAPGLSRLISKEQHDKACLSFLSATNDLINQNLMDRLIIKSPKGLLYDSDDMPTERVSDVLSKRIGK